MLVEARRVEELRGDLDLSPRELGCARESRTEGRPFVHPENPFASRVGPGTEADQPVAALARHRGSGFQIKPLVLVAAIPAEYDGAARARRAGQGLARRTSAG